MRRHVNAGTVAAFREDLLPPRRAARIASHLSACPRCAQVGAQVAEVTALLSASGPPPLPGVLAARLEAALTGEMGRRDSDAPPEVASHPHAGGPESTRRGWRRPRLTARLAAGAAVVVAVAAGGVYGLAGLASGPGPGGPAAPSALRGASGSSAARPPAVNGSARRPGGGTSHPSGGAAVVPARNGVSAPASGAGLPLVASGTNYQAGQLARQIAAVLARYPTGGTTAAAPAPRPLLPTAFGQLAACVSRVTGGRQPRLVDIARYAGRPAAVIMVPEGSVTVAWVVGPACSSSGGGVLGRVTLPAAG